MVFRSDLSLEPFELLLTQVNEDYQTNFNKENVRLHEEGVSSTNKFDKTSSIMLVAKEGYHGVKRFYYDRIGLDKFLGDKKLFVRDNTYKHTEELIPLINKQLGIGLTEYDVLKDYLSLESTTAVRISPRSIAYEGNIQIALGPESGFLFERITNKVLSGFNI